MARDRLAAIRAQQQASEQNGSVGTAPRSYPQLPANQTSTSLSRSTSEQQRSRRGDLGYGGWAPPSDTGASTTAATVAADLPPLPLPHTETPYNAFTGGDSMYQYQNQQHLYQQHQQPPLPALPSTTSRTSQEESRGMSRRASRDREYGRKRSNGSSSVYDPTAAPVRGGVGGVGGNGHLQGGVGVASNSFAMGGAEVVSDFNPMQNQTRAPQPPLPTSSQSHSTYPYGRRSEDEEGGRRRDFDPYAQPQPQQRQRYEEGTGDRENRERRDFNPYQNENAFDPSPPPPPADMNPYNNNIRAYEPTTPVRDFDPYADHQQYSRRGGNEYDDNGGDDDDGDLPPSTRQVRPEPSQYTASNPVRTRQRSIDEGRRSLEEGRHNQVYEAPPPLPTNPNHDASANAVVAAATQNPTTTIAASAFRSLSKLRLGSRKGSGQGGDDSTAATTVQQLDLPQNQRPWPQQHDQRELYNEKASTVNLVEREGSGDDDGYGMSRRESDFAAVKHQEPEKRRGGPTIKMGDVPFEDMSDFFGEISDIQASLREVNTSIQQIQALHMRLLALPSAEDVQAIAIQRQLEATTSSTRALFTSLKDRIQGLAQGNANLDALIDAGQSQYSLTHADVTVRSAQVNALKERFKDCIQKYSQVERDNRARNRARLEKQVRVVNPSLSQEESAAIVRQAEEGGGGQNLFSQAVLTNQRSYAARGALKEVESRAVELARIEQTLIELAQLFNDMAMMVEAQDVQIIAVEKNAVQVHKDMEHGLKDTQKAVVSARSARKYRWWCCGIFSIILLIVLIVIVVQVVLPAVRKNQNQNNSNNNNNNNPPPASTTPAAPTPVTSSTTASTHSTSSTSPTPTTSVSSSPSPTTVPTSSSSSSAAPQRWG